MKPAASGADGKVRGLERLLDLGLLRGAGRSLIGLLLVLFLLLSDLQDQLLDLVALRLHPLLWEPFGEVDWQVETGNGILFATHGNISGISERGLRIKHIYSSSLMESNKYISFILTLLLLSSFPSVPATLTALSDVNFYTHR